MDLTQGQQTRFNSVSERIFDKVERTFGKSADGYGDTGTQPGTFWREAAARELEVASRGLTFRVRVSVERE